jgi:predicted phosphate transport protein (TIGR00153 family)
MKINTILSIFTPKDAKFFPLLKDLADVLVQSASLLHELFTLEEKERRPEFCRLIKEEELRGDKISGAILKELNNTFITPFDREDVDSLADKVEEIIDVINRVGHKVLLYSPEKMPGTTIRLTEIILKGTVEIRDAVKELKNLKKSDTRFRRHYKEIKALEEDADGVYERGIMELFKNEKDTIELIKLKEITQELEKTANKINNAGKVLKTIFVKYA